MIKVYFPAKLKPRSTQQNRPHGNEEWLSLHHYIRELTMATPDKARRAGVFLETLNGKAEVMSAYKRNELLCLTMSVHAYVRAYVHVHACACVCACACACVCVCACAPADKQWALHPALQQHTLAIGSRPEQYLHLALRVLVHLPLRPRRVPHLAAP